jgi:U3 small nucleolar RNA-associated protein MPP10
VYEAEYVRAAAGYTAPPDKQEALRAEASALFKRLCAKLDALSAFHYTPKPVVHELEVRACDASSCDVRCV